MNGIIYACPTSSVGITGLPWAYRRSTRSRPDAHAVVCRFNVNRFLSKIYKRNRADSLWIAIEEQRDGCRGDPICRRCGITDTSIRRKCHRLSGGDLAGMSVVEQNHWGLGGAGLATIYLRDSDEVVVVDFNAVSPHLDIGFHLRIARGHV